MTEPTILWQPPDDPVDRLTAFQRSVSAAGGPELRTYDDTWKWSTSDLDGFWSAVWRFFEIPHDGDAAAALAEDRMPGAVWFPGVRLNYAEAMLRMPGRTEDDVVVISRSQSRAEVRLTAAQLRALVARVRSGLQRAGVGDGDRVAAYAPNIPETLAVMLAAASLGAVFSSCAPEFGTQSVIDRLSQIAPKVLVTVDGYQYGTRSIDRRGEVDAIRAALPSVETLVWLPYLDESAAPPAGAVHWHDLTAQEGSLEFVRVPFDHPLYLLFSSGTTGLPKPIVHGHGGITVEHLKTLAFHHDLGSDDLFFWFSTTGWMMWNFLVSGLGVGATIVMFDGNPTHPGTDFLWRLAADVGVTYFGTSAPFLLQCRKDGLVPREIADLSRIRGVGSTGAPLPAEGFEWVYSSVGTELQLASISGGTDVCSAFVGAAPTVPVYSGEIACRCLGAAVAAYDENARPVIGRVGELVIERPMPSMPLGFWGDDDGSRYRAAYFEDIPGVWRHGDWITISEYGSCTITGRSDATLNRGGVRLGTSEFYRAIEVMPEIVDSLVVHLEDDQGGAGTLILFVQPAPGVVLDDELRQAISQALRTRLSPRHVPDLIHAIRLIPRTLSGKRIEVPVKRILQGVPVAEAVAAGALTDPDAMSDFADFRREHTL